MRPPMVTADKYKQADTRGVPSLVWRAGQDRRLAMIRAAAGWLRHRVARAFAYR